MRPLSKINENSFRSSLYFPNTISTTNYFFTCYTKILIIHLGIDRGYTEKAKKPGIIKKTWNNEPRT